MALVAAQRCCRSAAHPSSWPAAVVWLRSYSTQVAKVDPDTAADLLYEVGWESRHTFLDVRTPQEFRKARVRGALNFPLLLPTDAAAGSSASEQEGEAPLVLKDGTQLVRNTSWLSQVQAALPADSRLIVGSANAASKRAETAVQQLQGCGYQFVLQMTEGMAGWAERELPMESDYGEL